MRRSPLPAQRARYRVRRPNLPLDCCVAVLHAVAGAGAITLGLLWAGLIQ